jgi:DNA-binding GntR family transcriptional regulator
MTQAEEVYRTIKKEIISGELPSDTPLREMEISQRFNVSRTPVREALRRLASEKMIRTIPNVGSFVGAFTWEEVKDVFAIRQILEVYAGGLAAIHINKEGLEGLEILYNKMTKSYEANDYEGYANLDEEFHEFINKTSNNNLLLDTIHMFNDRAKLARLRRTSYAKGDMKLSLDQHRLIINAMKNHNAKEAGELLLSHGQFIFSGITQNHIVNIFGREDK